MKGKRMKSFYSIIGGLIAGMILTCYGAQNTKEFPFVTTKNDSWSLSEEFVARLAQMFDVDVFIESGTGYGGTTGSAAKYFKHVYTIELEDVLYKQAVEHFKGQPHVHPLHGDSGQVLPTVLNKVRGKRFFSGLMVTIADMWAMRKAPPPLCRNLPLYGMQVLLMG